MMESNWMPMLVLVAAFGFYFLAVVPGFERLTRPVAGLLGVEKGRSWVVSGDIARLAVATMGQGVFFVLLAWFIHPPNLSTGLPLWRGCLYGVLLGIGEMGAVALLVHIVLTILGRVSGNRFPKNIAAWIPHSRGGWMRYYFNTLRSAPLRLRIILTFGYVGIEELVYRGIVVGACSNQGAVIAVVFSTALFVLAQVGTTPSWKTALFPVLGALVVGPVHAYLYYTVPDITPLIVGHVVFFMASAA